MSAEFVYQNKAFRRLTIVVLVSVVAYQAVLCLIHTHVFPVPRALVGVGEGLIMLAALPLLLPRLVPGVLAFAALAGAMLCLLALLSGSLDIKVFRDLLIPIWFFWLGRNVGDPGLANKALASATVLVLAFGFFELLALTTYTEVFDIFSYYVSIGNLQPVTDYVRESRLQLNGIRPEDMGRTLLPGLLDNHRVSSLFLEPVSLGNFATILAAWGLSKDRSELGWTLLFLGAAVTLIVLADSRFALISVSLLVVMRLLLRGWALNLPVVMPLLIVAVLVALGLFAPGPYDDSYLGRLINSGDSLVHFQVSTLLGYDGHAWYPDQGYAHVISSYGLVLSIALWLVIWLIRQPDSQGQRFRCFVAVYISLILCVSGTSLFALKSAGVLWFLFGCVLRDPAPLPVSTHKQPNWRGWGRPAGPVQVKEAKA